MSRWSHADLATVLARNPDLRINRGSSDLAIKRPVTSRADRQGDSSNPAIQPARDGKAAKSDALQPLAFTVIGSPVPKPRQTRSDKWKKRPSVLRYRTWADEARKASKEAMRRQFPNVRFWGELRFGRIQAVAFFKMPGSWNKTTKAKMKGQPHTLRPDADNLLKAVGDSLFPTGDEHLHDLHITKYWDDGNGARTVITLS